MSDTQPHNPSAPELDAELAAELAADLDSGDDQFTADDTLDAVARVDAAAEQLVDETSGSIAADESIDDLLAEVEALDEPLPAESAAGQDSQELDTSSVGGDVESIEDIVNDVDAQAVGAADEAVSAADDFDFETPGSEPANEITDSAERTLISAEDAVHEPVEAAADADDDSEALFDSDFDPVEAVLDDVFETKAALVQEDESTTVIVREDEAAPPDESAAAEDTIEAHDDHAEAAVAEPVDEQPEVDAEVDDVVDVDVEGIAEVVADSVDSVESSEGEVEETYAAPAEELSSDDLIDSPSDMATADDETESDSSVDDPVEASLSDEKLSDEKLSEEKLPEPDESVEDDAVGVVTESVPESPVTAAVPVAAVEDIADAAPEPSKEQKPRVDVVALLNEQINRAYNVGEPVLRSTLIVCNKPLRYVPTSLRPLVDYLALTLIMWIPIVWAIVWLVKQ